MIQSELPQHRKVLEDLERRFVDSGERELL